MSSFTEASFEPVIINGKPVKREGRVVYAIRGQGGNGLRFDIGFDGSGLSIRVPEGFQTDGPSIPGVFRWLIPQSVVDKAMKSAAVHDYLCEHKRFTRPDADGQFWVAMHAEGTPGFWRDIFFKAVTINKSKARYNDQAFDGESQPDLFGGSGGGSGA